MKIMDNTSQLFQSFITIVISRLLLIEFLNSIFRNSSIYITSLFKKFENILYTYSIYQWKQYFNSIWETTSYIRLHQCRALRHEFLYG